MGTKRHECIGEGCIRCKKSKEMYDWRYKNISKQKEYQDNFNKKYYEKNKEKIIEQNMNYYAQNKDVVNARKKVYQKENKEYFKKIKKEYHEKNRERLTKAMSDRYYDNRKEYIKKQVAYKKKKYHSDPEYRLKECLSARIRGAFKYKTNKKNTKTTELIGCSIKELKIHLEKQFQEGMTWANYGEWHVDHRVPCDSFDLLSFEKQRECFHYTNLQPLWAKDNIIKSCVIE